MSFPYESQPGQNQEPTPAEALNEAIVAAEAGQMPRMTSDMLLQRLELTGEEPDKKTLIQRFMNGVPTFSTLRAIPPLIDGAYRLIDATNKRTANEAEEHVTHMIGDVITKQIEREGDICPGARRIAMASTRDDIISPTVKERILTSAQRGKREIEARQTELEELAAQMEVMESVLPQILGQIILHGRPFPFTGRPVVVHIVSAGPSNPLIESRHAPESTYGDETTTYTTNDQPPEADKGQI